MEDFITKLKVGDEDFLVASMIERCPKTMMLRELVQNGLEAAPLATTGGRRIEITAQMIDGVRKLRLWNTGPGLDADELFRMCDIASSIGKVQQLDGNFGMGAKVASLPSNHLGVRYRSCSNGRVNEIIIGKRNGTYGRVLRRTPQSGDSAAVVDVTEEVRAAGIDLGYDWTEVVLLGNRPDQDTVADPYDGNPRVPRDWVLRALQQRFFRVAGDIQIMLGPDIHNMKELRPFVPLASHMARSFARYEAVPLQDGIVVRFGYDPAHPELPNRNASYIDRLSPDTSFAGLLFNDEFYDFRTGARWTQEAPSFGIGFGARHLSIAVELPPGYPVRAEGYRQFLRYRNGLQDQVRLADFAGMVRASRPEWVRELVRSLAPDQGLIGNVREQLQNLIASLGIKRVRPLVRRPLATDAPATLVKGVAAPAAPAPAGNSADAGTPAKAAAAPSPNASQSGQPTRASVEIEGLQVGVIEDLEVMPELLLLRSEQEITDRNLRHRAARFYPDTHQLYINMRYPSVLRLVDLLVESAAADAPPAVAREVAQAVAENILVLKLGRSLIYGLSKRAAEQGWTDHERQQVLSSEVLTVAADDLSLALPTARAMFAERLALRSGKRGVEVTDEASQPELGAA